MSGSHLRDDCACGRQKQARSKRCAWCAAGAPPVTLPSVDRVAQDRARKEEQSVLLSLKKKYDEALTTIARLEEEHAALDALSRPVDTFTIQPKEGSGTSEATPVLVASDWHIEERVGPEVGDLNTYSLDIAQQRATKFFQSGLRLIRLLQQDVRIHTAVLALLGDFISNELHGADSAETNAVHPTDAIERAQAFLVSGLEFLLDHSDLSFIIPCHSGNHARTTQKTRFASENGHSLEYLMYRHLAAYFRQEPRLSFIIPAGMHSYVTVYGQTIRFQHGHAIKYNGGVGGIFIPAYKAIAQWNKGRRADLDVFGHFHQMKDGGNFLVNGSLIGYNAFALSIKADYEQPRQLLFLMDKKRGRTCTWPVMVN